MHIRFRSSAIDRLSAIVRLYSYYLLLNEEVVDRLLEAIGRADTSPPGTVLRLEKVVGVNLYRSEGSPSGAEGIFLSDIPASATASGKTVCLDLVASSPAHIINLVVVSEADPEEARGFLARVDFFHIYDAMLVAAAPASLEAVVRRYATIYPDVCVTMIERGIKVFTEDNTPELVPVLPRLSAADLQPLLHSTAHDIRARARVLLGRALLNTSASQGKADFQTEPPEQT